MPLVRVSDRHGVELDPLLGETRKDPLPGAGMVLTVGKEDDRSTLGRLALVEDVHGR
jgi:hypothetical protein